MDELIALVSDAGILPSSKRYSSFMPSLEDQGQLWWTQIWSKSQGWWSEWENGRPGVDQTFPGQRDGWQQVDHQSLHFLGETMVRSVLWGECSVLAHGSLCVNLERAFQPTYNVTFFVCFIFVFVSLFGWITCTGSVALSCSELNSSCCSDMERVLWQCGMGWGKNSKTGIARYAYCECISVLEHHHNKSSLRSKKNVLT